MLVSAGESGDSQAQPSVLFRPVFHPFNSLSLERPAESQEHYMLQKIIPAASKAQSSASRTASQSHER